MHSPTGSLRCVDCEDERQFPSAASLLSHFAQHILDNDTSRVSSATSPVSGTSTPSCRKKKGNSILEQVLQRASSKHSTMMKHVQDSGASAEISPLHQHPPFSKLSHSNISLQKLLKRKLELSSECTITPTSVVDNDKEHIEMGISRSSSCSSRSSNSSNSSFSGRTKLVIDSAVNLATFDMQERLENCVLNLVSKQNGKRTADTSFQDLPNKKNYSEVNENWETSSIPEEINPLTICKVTFEDEDTGWEEEELKLLDTSHKPGARKQQAPKKIARPVNGMLSELSSKLPQHTTITSISPPNPSPEREKPHKKKYPCHICSKVFGWSTDLKRHILIHTGERPFKCRLCPSSFTRNFLLQKHEKKVHHRYNARKPVDGQLDAIALRLQSMEPKDKLNTVLPNNNNKVADSNGILLQREEDGELSEEQEDHDVDDRSSADENDNHSRKRKKDDIELQEKFYAKQPWLSKNVSQQPALQQT